MECGGNRSRIKFLAKNPPAPSQMLHWVLNTSLIPPNHPDYFCERIIHTSRFFSMPELSATPSATWKIISNSSCHFQKVLGLLALYSMYWSLHFFLYIVNLFSLKQKTTKNQQTKIVEYSFKVSSRKQPSVSPDYNLQFRVNVKISNTRSSRQQWRNAKQTPFRQI